MAQPRFDAIVVFGGEDVRTRVRSRAAARWYHRMLRRGFPAPLIVVTGGAAMAVNDTAASTISEAQAMASYLLAAGVPPAHIILEERARNTLGNVLLTQALLRPLGLRRVALLSDHYHLWRCYALFRLAWGKATEVTLLPTGERASVRRWWHERVAFVFQAAMLKLRTHRAHEMGKIGVRFQLKRIASKLAEIGI